MATAKPCSALSLHTLGETEGGPSIFWSLWSSGGGTRLITHDRVALPRDSTLSYSFAFAEEGEVSGLCRHITGPVVLGEDAEKGVPEEVTAVGLTEYR